MTKIVVLGRDGQLGQELCRQLGPTAIGLDRDVMDITCPDEVQRTLFDLQPATIINAAAYTDVDGAEQNSEGCHAVNSTAVAGLVKACTSVDCKFVQISTDYVFGKDANRKTPYREDDTPAPLGVYGHSKLAGEQHAKGYSRHFVVRTCGLYGEPGRHTIKGNFIDTMLDLASSRDHLRIVNDQQCTPTYVPHLAKAVVFLIQTESYGIFHVTNRGSTNWFELASEIFRQRGLQVDLEPISTHDFGAAAPRPRYSVLDTKRYHALNGPPMPVWREALTEYLARRP